MTILSHLLVFVGGILIGTLFRKGTTIKRTIVDGNELATMLKARDNSNL